MLSACPGTTSTSAMAQARAPSINRLPIEILSIILHLASPIPEPSLRRDPVLGRRCSWTISHVCKEWRSWILDTSQLWSYIRTEELIAVPTLLERAKDKSLVVVIEAGEMESGDNTEKAFGRANRQLLQQWYRIRELQLYGRANTCWGDIEWNFIHGNIARTAPMLERLELHGQDPFTIEPLLIGKYPRLKRLHLGSFATTWDLPVLFSNLTELHFSTLLDTDTQLSQLLDVLHANPNLEIFEYSFTVLFELEVSETPLVPAILKRLRKVILCMPVDACRSLLEVLDVPRDVDWDIRLADYFMGPPVVILPRSLPQDKPVSVSIDLARSGLLVGFTCEWLTITDDSPRPRLKLGFDWMDIDFKMLPEALKTFALYFRFPIFWRMKTLKIRRPKSIPSRRFNDFHWVLKAVPSLQELMIDGLTNLISDLRPGNKGGETSNQPEDRNSSLQQVDGEALPYNCPCLTTLQLVQSRSDDLPEEINLDWFCSEMTEVIDARRNSLLPIKSLHLKGDFFDQRVLEIFQPLVDDVQWMSGADGFFTGDIDYDVDHKTQG